MPCWMDISSRHVYARFGQITWECAAEGVGEPSLKAIRVDEKRRQQLLADMDQLAPSA